MNFNVKFNRTLLAVPALGVAAVGLSMWSTVPYTPLEASSHREAPLIGADPVADNTDLYAFRDPVDATKIDIIANYIPFELPHGGPNYSTFGENVRYEIHVKNDGSTNVDDITYRFTFQRVNDDPSTFFNIRLAHQNLRTTYTCQKSTDGGATFTTILTNGRVAPNNIGPRSINGAAGLNSPISYTQRRLDTDTLATAGNSAGERMLCGPSDDPFYADLGAIFDLAGLRPGAGAMPGGPNTAPDGLSHKNCHSIVLQIPINTLRKAGVTGAPANILDSNYIIGVWASASRPAMQTFSTAAGAGATGTYVQVSRLGMPLTNEVINPIGAKDAWNAASPYAEAAVTEDYLSNPELDLYMADNMPVAPANTTKPAGQTYYGEAVPALSALRIQSKSLYGQAALGGASFPGFDFRNGANGLSILANNPTFAPALVGTAFDPATYGPYLLVPGKPRSADIKPIFHTGVPNAIPYQLATGKTNNNPLTAGKPFINNFLLLTQGGAHGGDMLRLNMAVPATPRTDPNFSNQGLLAAAALGLTTVPYNNINLQFIPNMDGFPNGRRLEDAVDQIELKAAGGVVLAAVGLWYDDFTPTSTNPVTAKLGGVLGFTTGVERNDTTIRADFPYVQTPWIGTGAAGGPTDVLTYPNLTVSTVMPVDAGTYNNITITNGGTARFNGPIVVRGTLTIQTGGTLDTRGVLATSCVPVTGPGSFVMQTGATLRVCDANGIAASGASGSIQLTPRTFGPDGTFVYNGGGAQTAGTGLPTAVRSLTVDNGGGGLTLSNPLSVAQVVALTNGNLNTTATNRLTLLSTPTAGTALVVNTAGFVNGPATMQRAIATINGYTGPGYHHYSSPVANTPNTDLTTSGFTPNFNTLYNSAPVNNSVVPFPNVFAYDQARVTDPSNTVAAFNQGFVVPQSGDPLDIMSGYAVNIAANQVVDLNGTLNTGPQSRTGLQRGAGAQSGWQFLGNPYPSPIDFTLTGGVTRTNMDAAIYVWQATSQYNGQYRNAVNGVGTANQVAAMQGFFTRVTTAGTPGSFALTDAARVTTFSTQPTFNRSTPDPRPLVNLRLQGSNTPLLDDAYVYFQQGATAGFDPQMDAYKLANSSGLSVGSIIAGNELSINGLPLLTGPTTVPLNLNVPAAGSYTLYAASLVNFGATNVYLLDTQTGTRTNLGQQASYTFSTSARALPGRFSLFFGPAGALANKAADLAAQVQLFPNPAHGSFTLLLPAELGTAPVTAKLFNQLGQLVNTRTVSMTAAGASAQFDVSSLAKGVYTLQLSSPDHRVTKRVVVE